jgi:rod shape-determining protein MreC
MKIPQTVLQYVDIKKENASLRLEIDKLKIRAIVASGIEKEFEELKKSINFEYRSDPLKSIERILGFDKSIYNSYLLISVSQENTKEGAIVTVPQGLIGIITKKCKKFAKVLPITNSKILIPTKTDSGEHVILTGTDQNEMISNEIKSNTVTDLKIGEILSTSGEGGIYKKGIPVARITKIDKVKNQLMAKPLAKIDDLDFVSVANPVVQVQADVRERARS